MADNVIWLSGEPVEGDPVETVSGALQASMDADLDTVVVLGYDKAGNEHMVSSTRDGGTVMWLLERAKWVMMEAADGYRKD